MAETSQVHVAVRVRPLTFSEHARGCRSIVKTSRGSGVGARSSPQLELYDPAGLSGGAGQAWSRTFSDFDELHDHTQDGHGGQDDLYGSIGRRIFQSAWDGYNCSLFAYGQSGAGKTFTMVGEVDGRDSGILPRLCQEICKASTGSGHKASGNVSLADGAIGDGGFESIKVSYYELYNERVRDLLRYVMEATDVQHLLLFRNSTRPSSPALSPCNGPNVGDAKHWAEPKYLRVREHPTDGVYVEGLQTVEVETPDDVMVVLHHGMFLAAVIGTITATDRDRDQPGPRPTAYHHAYPPPTLTLVHLLRNTNRNAKQDHSGNRIQRTQLALTLRLQHHAEATDRKGHHDEQDLPS